MGTPAILNSAKNYFWPDEPAPSIHEGIKTPRPTQLVAYRFVPIEPAVAPEIIKKSAFVYALFVSGERLADVTHSQHLQTKRFSALDKELQHLQSMLQATSDKTNKVERWLNLGSALSMGLMIGGGQLPGLAGSAVNGIGLNKLPSPLGNWCHMLTKASFQKTAVRQIKDYGPQAPQMITMYANMSGEIYGSQSQKDGAMAQFFQGLENTWSAQNQDVKQNEKTLHDVLSGIISIEGRIEEKVVQTASAS